MQNKRSSLNGRVGFVPTMGALHAGHLELVKKSKSQNEKTIVSIFVNKTQFNDPQDYEKYEQNLEKDCELLKGLGPDFIFAPKIADMYPDDYRFRVSETRDSDILCGAHRPGHFNGVLTVVLKLLMLTKPDRAYFGEKDYQQLHLIKEMCSAFFLATEVVAVPTVRDENGLALSSRNARLNASELRLAQRVAEIFLNTPDEQLAREKIKNLGVRIEYLEKFQDRRMIAFYVGHVRLIDNVKIA